jgi:ATP-dependent DNA ligase
VTAPELPDFIPPMLAQTGRPFDSDEHLFEVKWDGFRAQALIGRDGVRLLSRNRKAYADYPGLEGLSQLPVGLALDGELVVMRDGKPSFEGMLKRRAETVTYVVFDVMYRDFASTMDEPLVERRKRLEDVVAAAPEARLVLSDGVVGGGLAFFEELGRRGLEGMIAKRLGSRYESGRRSGAWMKIKHAHTLLCAIIGYAADEAGQLKSLIVATNDDDGLRYVGKVGSGLSLSMIDRLQTALDERRTDAPLVPCPEDGRWVAPGLYCKVRYVERTSAGALRAPVFLELIDDGEA